MKVVMPVYGTRPEGIKMAPVVKEFQRASGFDVVCVATGQHRLMLDQVHRLFDIDPSEDLNIMTANQSLSDVATRVMQGLEPCFAKYSPDAVIVQGDTTTAMAAALAAFHARIPVVHVEAGLRSGSLHNPFPEEGNRRLIGQIAGLHLAPTSRAKAHLMAAGVAEEDIAVTGNTVIDSLDLVLGSTVPRFHDHRVAEAYDSPSSLVLVTVHRRENHGDPMRRIGQALAILATRFPDRVFVLPAHPNPAVRTSLLSQVEGVENLVVTPPVSYGEMVHLLRRCELVVTDSGGVQEEAPALGKPVLVLRDNTERTEGVEAGTVKLIGTEVEGIVSSVSQLFTSSSEYRRMATAVNPYGDGYAAGRTVAAVGAFLGVGARLPDFEAISSADRGRGRLPLS